MRKYGAFLVENNVYETYNQSLSAEQIEGSTVEPSTKVIMKGGSSIGVQSGDTAVAGFPTPSRKLEFYSRTLKDWHWPEYAIPGYIKSHVHRDNIDISKNEMLLLPTFRLPTLVHSRSGNAKWLYEISHKNPIWMHTSDAERLKITTASLVKVETSIGYFIDRVWVTEAIRPGVVGCSHHLGRWRLQEDTGNERWSSALVDLKHDCSWAVDDAADSRHPPVCQSGCRFVAHLLGGCGCAPEPRFSGAARSGQRTALLAPEGDCDSGGPARPVRRRIRRHQQSSR